MKTNPRALAFVLFALTALGATGCVGPNARVLPPNAIVVTEYEQVFVTGSNIPVRVPKGQRDALHSTSPMVIIRQEDVQRALGPGMIPLK